MANSLRLKGVKGGTRSLKVLCEVASAGGRRVIDLRGSAGGQGFGPRPAFAGTSKGDKSRAAPEAKERPGLVERGDFSQRQGLHRGGGRPGPTHGAVRRPGPAGGGAAGTRLGALPRGHGACLRTSRLGPHGPAAAGSRGHGARMAARSASASGRRPKLQGAGPLAKTQRHP